MVKVGKAVLDGTEACSKAELGTLSQILSMEIEAALVDEAIASVGTLEAPESMDVLLLLSGAKVEDRVGKIICDILRFSNISKVYIYFF